MWAEGEFPEAPKFYTFWWAVVKEHSRGILSKKSLGGDGIKINVDYRTENIPLLEIIQSTRIKCLQSKRDGLTMEDKEIYNKCVQKAEGVLVFGG